MVSYDELRQWYNHMPLMRAKSHDRRHVQFTLHSCLPELFTSISACDAAVPSVAVAAGWRANAVVN